MDISHPCFSKVFRVEKQVKTNLCGFYFSLFFFSFLSLNGQMCDYQNEIVVIYNGHLHISVMIISLYCLSLVSFVLLPISLDSPQNIFGGLCVYILSPFLEMEQVYLIKLVKFMGMWHFIF